MIHNITEFHVRDDIYASHDIRDGFIAFRLFQKRGKHYDLRGMSVVTDHKVLGECECYTELTDTSHELVNLEDFRVLFEALKIHVAWFKRSPHGRIIPYPICPIYVKNKYGNSGLLSRAKEIDKFIKENQAD